MKNLKVSKKLIIGFLIIAVFTAVVGVMGIVSLLQVDKAINDLYEHQMEPLLQLADAIETLQRMQVSVREYEIGVAEQDMSGIDAAHNNIEKHKITMKEDLDAYRATMAQPEAIRLFDEARALYDGYAVSLEKCYELAKRGDFHSIDAELAAMNIVVKKIEDNFDTCMEYKRADAIADVKMANDLTGTLLILIVAVLVIALAAALFFALYISALIHNPLTQLTSLIDKASATGDITLRPDDVERLDKLAQVKDEIGQCIGAVAAFFKRIHDVGYVMEVISDKDLTAEFTLLSDSDTMGNSLQKMLENLNDMIAEIHSVALQINTGASEVTDGAMLLAQVSVEQAADIGELSGAVTDISGKTKSNAGLIDRAAELAHSIKNNAEKGNRQMDELMAAVNEITQASHNINQVIKVIDDIAFQTNILALNAAVEAARAGTAGKGFAVVADEVRNLASKSSEAAKNTGQLILNSIEKADLGARIAEETAASLAEIVSGINESNQIVSEIASSSEEQFADIEIIKTDISKVTSTVQQNSATAEQSAATAEEMKSQAAELEGLVSMFRLKKK